jgi:succinyl-diaminopimelate desuccinylase
LTPQELLSKLISFVSLTPTDAGAFDFISSYLCDFESIRIDKGGVTNLLLIKKFGDGMHLSFAGHVDVVPAGEGWNSDPFEATLIDDYIYGRGTSDMKAGVAAMLYAAKNMKNFNGTISLMLTADEEGDAIHGTVEILEYMKEKNILPDICLVGEPTCEKVFGDTIKAGRRGSINGVLTIEGLGGHAAYPEKASNPISIAAQFLQLVSDKKLDNGDDYFAPSQLVVTDIQGGYGKHNVIPSQVKILFNVRNSTHTDVKSVEAFVKEALSKSQATKYELNISQSSNAFMFQPNAISEKLISTLKTVISQTTAQMPKLSTAGGTSDARFIALYGTAVVEFGVRNDTIHAPNERVALAELNALAEIYSQLIEAYAD